MNTFQKLTRSSILYLFGTVSSKIVSFFLLPIYTKYLKPSDYGVYDVMMAYILVATSVLFFDIWRAVLRFMYECSENHDKYKPIQNGLIIFVFSTILYTIVLYVASLFIKIQYFELLFFCGLLSNVTQYYSYVARGFGYDKAFVISGVVATVVVAISNIILIVYLKLGVASLFIATILSSIVNIVLLELKVKLIKNWSVNIIDFLLIKKMFIYALPFCVNSLSFWLLASYNKVAISNTLSMRDNGLYAISGRFSSLLNLAAGCFSLAWQETSFARAGTDSEKGIFFTKAFNKYIKFIISASIGLLPIIWFVFPILVDKSFDEAKNYISLYIIGTILSIIASFFESIFANIMKTRAIFYSTLVGAIVNIIFVNLLLKRIGVNGANIAFIAGYFAVILIRIFLLKKYISFKTDNFYLLLSSVLMVFYVVIYQYGGLLGNGIALIFSVLFFALSFKSDIEAMYTKYTQKKT